MQAPAASGESQGELVRWCPPFISVERSRSQVGRGIKFWPQNHIAIIIIVSMTIFSIMSHRRYCRHGNLQHYIAISIIVVMAIFVIIVAAAIGQVLCRTGYRGTGQTSKIMFGGATKLTEESAIREGQRWLVAERIRQGL